MHRDLSPATCCTSLRYFVPNHNSHTSTADKDLGQFRTEAGFALIDFREGLCSRVSCRCDVSWVDGLPELGGVIGGSCELARHSQAEAQLLSLTSLPAFQPGTPAPVLSHDSTGRLEQGLAVVTGFPY